MIADCRLQIEAARIALGKALSSKIYNLQSETGNPPEGWESAGQIINQTGSS